ncbi:CaiB/BaiF CoA transferase family protein [Verticiella sediminum]|uniref:CaiB/BaiF CoA transferase family protein n=1 Tax=Verticiella sediminum TaxID=1247510 RepID=UPI001FE2D296|nr:CoA transferase [Verticiella sediminum]
MSDAALPFEGLRILDLSQGIAGPYCTQILAQQGATVIKVEPPQGDWGRGVGTRHGEHNALSIAYNAGKRGVCVDARQADGQALLRALAAACDVVVQNFRPGVVERMGLDYARLSAGRPELVYLSISGYGDAGPGALAPASDSVMQADAGLMSINRGADGVPHRIGLLLADLTCATQAAQAVAAALYKQARSGRGQHIKLNLLQSCAALMTGELIETLLAGGPREGAVSAPNGVFATADGLLSVLALNDAHFARLCRALDRPEWLADARFADNASRMAHKAVLHEALGAQLASASNAAWSALFAQHDVLHAPVRALADLPAHPQAAHLGLFEPVQAEGCPAVPLARLPALGDARALTPPPGIGEHTVAVLREQGLDDIEIERLLAAGVIRQRGVAAAGSAA